jgi:hypothetical protein
MDVNYRAHKANPLYPAFLEILFLTRNMEGWDGVGWGVETTGKIRKIEITENTLFY